MGKKKILAALTALSMLASASIGLVQTAYAADDAVEKGISLEYDSNNSTETAKVVKLYYEGAEGVYGASVTLELSTNNATNAVFTPSISSGANVTPNTTTLKEGSFSFNMSIVTEDPLSNDENLMGTVVFTVPEKEPSFTVSVTTDSNLSVDAGVLYCDATSIKVDGYKNAAAAIAVSDAEASVEDEVDVTFTLSDNAVGIAYLKLTLDCSSELTIADLTRGDALSALNIDSATVSEGYITFSGTAGDTSNGTIGTLTLKTPSTAGDYTVNIIAEAKDADGIEIPVNVTAGTIKVTAPSSTEKDREEKITDGEGQEDESFDYTVEKGLKLEYDSENSTDTEKKVNVYYVGADGVYGASVTLELNTNNATNAVFTPSISSGANVTPNTTTLKEGAFSFNMSIVTEDPLSNDENLMGTVVFTVPEKEPSFTVSVTTDSNLSVDAGVLYCDEEKIKVEGYTESTGDDETFEADTDVAMKDTIAEDYDKYDGSDTYGDLIALDVTATKTENDETVDAAYSEDYVAYYGEKELTETEFKNLINGYDEDKTVEDIVNNLTFKSKYGVTFATAPVYQTAAQKDEGKVTVIDELADPETAAKEQEETVTYTVTFVDEDGDEVKVVENVTKNGKLTSSQIPTVPEKSGYTGKWVLEGTKTSFTTSTKVTKDLVVEPYYTKKESNNNSSSGRSSSSGSSSSAIASSSTSSSGVAASTPGFLDLNTVPWAQTAINILAANGIVNGTSDTTFEPLANVTRAQFAKMVCSTFGIAASSPATASFTDVAPTDWYYGYVEAAAAAGIINGVSDTEFAPNNLITREQMAAMMYRAINATGAVLKSGTAVTFTDAASISEYAAAAVNALSAAGVINGMDDGSFAPQETATRAQAACIIYQYFAALVK